MSHDKLVEDLRAWSSVAWQRGSPDSAKLLDTAASRIEDGQHDAGLAAEVLAYSCRADTNSKVKFADVLLRAGEALLPPLERVSDLAPSGKSARPRSIAWDLVDRPAEAGGRRDLME